MKKLYADRIEGLAQSDIRRMSLECARVDGINLGQGICDQPIDPLIKEATIRAIHDDRSIYTRLDGIDELRHRIAKKVRDYNHIPCDPEGEVVVNVGSTGSFVTACLAFVNPGDEVILFSPFYGYHLNILKTCGAVLKFITLQPPDWSYDPDALEAAFSKRTKFILVNTPSNPCGKVFSRAELTRIAELCRRHDALCVTDEIYEYILCDGREHVSPGSLPGMQERTITISGFSKTYAMTGWRLGYSVAPKPLAAKMAILSDLINICAPSPLQYGVVAAFDLPESYYATMRADYQVKRDMTVEACRAAGFTPYVPQGAYYMLADFRALGFKDDQEAARLILERARVAVIPGSSFYVDPRDGRTQVRLCYAKKMKDLEEACRRIAALRQEVAR
ncbi:MAG TPA: aminotransferase class I/II-fold pyridoxal phosphate-dependent enzyme [Candidatus Polarisedimenticolia bacterium]|nr:aminotransferase class I/II-fold pyridoxal phosphate-dependent enzyme [Candidatus Polarisedimenticolia bacterium]